MIDALKSLTRKGQAFFVTWKKKAPRAKPFLLVICRCYIRSIIALPNWEHDTSFAPSISRAKS